MKLSIVRGGGFAGLVQTITVDAKALSPDDADELKARVKEAKLFDLPSKPGAEAEQPDRFTYLVTVEEGARRHRVALAEESLPEAVRSLLSWARAVPGRVERVESPGRGKA